MHAHTQNGESIFVFLYTFFLLLENVFNLQIGFRKKIFLNNADILFKKKGDEEKSMSVFGWD